MSKFYFDSLALTCDLSRQHILDYIIEEAGQGLYPEKFVTGRRSVDVPDMKGGRTDGQRRIEGYDGRRSSL